MNMEEEKGEKRETPKMRSRKPPYKILTNECEQIGKEECLAITYKNKRTGKGACLCLTNENERSNIRFGFC